ncbi:MAG: hypothetical protein ACSLEL_03425 [Candidatus Malihini olakiniferum]
MNTEGVLPGLSGSNAASLGISEAGQHSNDSINVVDWVNIFALALNHLIHIWDEIYY